MPMRCMKGHYMLKALIKVAKSFFKENPNQYEYHFMHDLSARKSCNICGRPPVFTVGVWPLDRYQIESTSTSISNQFGGQRVKSHKVIHLGRLKAISLNALKADLNK